MSALEDATDKVKTRLAFDPAAALAQATMAQAIATVAEAEEKRIGNLIALLPSIAHGNRQKIMDELSKRLGIKELY